MSTTRAARAAGIPAVRDRSAGNADLRLCQGLVIAAVVLAFPVAATAVYAYDADRQATADLLATVFSVGLYAAFSTPWWPLPSLRDETPFLRLQAMCMVWFWITYTIHVTWELLWLFLRDRIIASANAPWAYIWWAYIDGGDMRYASTDPNLFTMEVLSVVNGLLGFTALFLWRRTGGSSSRAVLIFMATAVVHLYATALYFGGEIVQGLPNVDTSSFLDLWVKFVLANSPWLVLPWFVLYWGARTLRNLSSARPAASANGDPRASGRGG